MNRLRTLIVDDDKNIRTTLSVYLKGLGCEVSSAASADEGAEMIGRRTFDVVFLDLHLGPGSGLDLLPKLLAANPSIQTVVITAYAAVETAVEAMRRGAADYLPKPFTPEQIEQIVSRLTRERGMRRSGAAPQAGTSEAESGPHVGGPHTVKEVERAHIQHILSTSPSLEAAASILGIDASTLWRKRKKYAR